MLDYIIVGLGISGASIAFRLEEKGKNFLIFEDGSQQASKVAGGLMNPVILKRFTLAWNADEQLETAKDFYHRLESHLDSKFLHPVEIYRRFSSIEEQNNWFEAADKPRLAAFLDTSLKSSLNSFVPAKHSFGKVLETARIDTTLFLETYETYLLQKGLMKHTRFDYEALNMSNEGIEYKGIRAKKVIFCDGFGLYRNPFFNYLPMVGNKGEYIIIKSPQLKLNVTIKSSVFVSPLGNDLYAVGATYNNRDKTPGETPEAREELKGKLDQIVTAEYEIVNQIAGIRPSTIDRRPLVGRHPELDRLYCCNGFGSRGILLAPTASKELLGHAEYGDPLSPEINLSRFTKKHYPKN